MPTIAVNLPDHHYDITVQPGLLNDIGKHLRSLSGSKRVAILSDGHVGPLYLPALQSSLEAANFEVISTTIPSGEDHKTLQTLLPVFDTFLAARIDRATPLLALGGGVIGDMTGFVAASILRGIPFVQIPTTLLAMVDASVGGKTGVNATIGKNLIGAFHQPIAVFIDPNTLLTLPMEQLRSGLAECIKHDIIRDAAGFAHLESTLHKSLSLDIHALTDLIAHNVAIKARVVEADPFEKGERAHLNFGHTFGHAIETVSHYELSHGQCVALGMVAASRLAVMLHLLDTPSCDRIIALIHKAGLPTTGLTLDVDQVVAAMAFDKKVKADRIRFILPTRIGEVIIRDDVPIDYAHDAVESLRD